ncbi:MAG: Ig-like domain-containing protein, partial [Planctomycetota bacterium]
IAVDDTATTDEDTSVVILASDLTANDELGPEDALDELASTTDTLTVTAVAMVDPNQGTVFIDPTSGDITFTPATDIFGDIEFVYTVTDTGVDESTDIDASDIDDPAVTGTVVDAPRTATATVTVTVDPVNDAPTAYDRAARTDEDTAITITATQLLSGTPDTSPPSAIAASVTQITLPDADQIIEGETLILTASNGRRIVVEFNSLGETSTGTDLVIPFVAGESGDILASRLQSTLRSLGFGGTANGPSVNFENVTAVSSVNLSSQIRFNNVTQSITLPRGEVLIDGETITLTDALGNDVTFVMTSTGSTVVPDAIAVAFTPADSSQTIAENLAIALRANGFGGSAETTTNTEVRVRLSGIEMVTNTTLVGSPNFTIDGDDVIIPDGTALDAGDRLVISLPGAADPVIVNFQTDGSVAVPDGELPLIFDVGDMPIDIATSLESLLNTAGVSATALTFTEWMVNVIDVPASGIALGTPSTLTVSGGQLTFPTIDAVLDGETFTLTDSTGESTTVELNTTGTLSAGTDIVVQFDPTATLDVLLADLATALRNVGIGVEVVTDGILLRDLVSIATNITASNIDTQGIDLIVPGGDLLLNGERLQLTGDGSSRIIEFNTTGVVADDVDAVVVFTTSDTSNLIASKLELALRSIGVGANADTDDQTIPAGRSLVTIQSNAEVRVGELAAVPGPTDPRVPTPINEDIQSLRVVRFDTQFGSVDITDADVVGLAVGDVVDRVDPNPVAGTTPERFSFRIGEIEIEGETVRVFDQITFTPASDYNEVLPFEPRRIVRYTIIDDGRNPDGTFEPATSRDGLRSNEATLTITVAPQNDAPIFDLTGAGNVNILEVDGTGVVVVESGFVSNIFGGPLSATDEQGQLVDFRISDLPADVNDPDGIMAALPEVIYTPGDNTGDLQIRPAEDQYGQATFVLIGVGVDEFGNENGPEQRTTFTINVLPVNDAPRVNPAIADGTPVVAGDDPFATADEAYRVLTGEDSTGDGELDRTTIQYNLREDNTQPTGDPANPVTTGDYFIPLRQVDAPQFGPYQRIGLLDVYTVGPDNELVGPTTPGGLQTGGPQALDVVLPTLVTDQGGTLRPAFGGTNNDVVIGYFYTPPVDFNNDFPGDIQFDSFEFTVVDRNTAAGGESFQLGNPPIFIDDPKSSTSRVILNLQPVNDRPVFQTRLPSDSLRYGVEEDGDLQVDNSFALGIFPGPSESAFDELDPVTANDLEFTIRSLSFEAADEDNFRPFFDTLDITPSGRLTFQPAPDVFGTFEFEVVLTEILPGNDFGENSTRGDLRSSIPVTLTIDVQPVNDRPVIDPASPALDFTLNEDGSVDILVEGDGSTTGMLDVFEVGPNNEATPGVGGGQTISLTGPIPETTAQGGTLTALDNAGNEIVINAGTDLTQITRFRYRPRANYVGPDNFNYVVTDNGITISTGPNGGPFDDAQTTTGEVTFNVLPVNDAPQFSIGPTVTTLEDEDQGNGPGVISIASWATNVQAGPPNADDENQGTNAANGQPQSLRFEIVQIGGDDLFVGDVTASIADDGTASLNYQLRSDINTRPDNVVGDAYSRAAVFTAQLIDGGPSDLGNGDDNESDVRVFTISVDPVNDAPTFTPGDTVRILEDSGPVSQLWANPRVPGPADEVADGQTLTFSVQPVAASDLALFTTTGRPEIDANGILTFTTADDANGIARLQVTATDTEGASSAPVDLQIVIQPVNDTPTAIGESRSTNEDDIIVFTEAELLANERVDANADGKPDGDVDLADQNPDQLFISIPGDGDGEPVTFASRRGALVTWDPIARTMTYDPTGSPELQSRRVDSPDIEDSFQYQITDLAGSLFDPPRLSNTTQVTLSVSGVNDAPRVVDDSPTLNPTGSTEIDVLANDDGVDQVIDKLDPRVLEITSEPTFGSVVRNAEGNLVYTPLTTVDGEDFFTYRVRYDTDSNGTLDGISEEGRVTISPNAAPAAGDDALTLFRNQPINIDVLINDTDADGIETIDRGSIEITRLPRFGTAISVDDGTITYEPSDEFVGVDSFEYTVADSEGRRSNPALVSLNVVASRLQNPARNNDVNGNGEVSALDALLIINHLNRYDAILSSGLEIPPQSDLDVTGEDRIGDRNPTTGQILNPSFFLDTDGNNRISALDALRVINELNARDTSGTGSSGEPIGDSGLVPTAAVVTA